MALHAVMTGMVAAEAMVLVGPWLPEMDQWSAAILALGDRMPGAYIVCGERDDCLPGARLLADTLDLAGRPCRLTVPPGLDHEYPAGFAADLRGAVISVINKGGIGASETVI
jgi:acetyl esterase/lipase